MKKYLFLILSIFTFIFFTDNVNALSYSVNDIDYNVADVETLRDWFYFTYIKDSNYNGFFLIRNNNNGKYTIEAFYNFSYVVDSNNNTYSYDFYQIPNDSSYFNKYRRFHVQILSDYTLENTPSQWSITNYDTSFNKYAFGYTAAPPVYNTNLYDINGNIKVNGNFTFQDIENKYSTTPNFYTITYYLNNQVYQTITDVEEGSSHTLLEYTPEENYNFSGWSYDNNIDLTNIQSDINIYGTSSPKPIYKITYYVNNSKYYETSVIEGHSHSLINFPDFNKYTHEFSGWSYDNNIDLTNIQSDIDITSSLTELTKTPVYIDFPISKEEFYVLLVLVGTLNMIIFLKWCFPFKSGSDLK